MDRQHCLPLVYVVSLNVQEWCCPSSQQGIATFRNSLTIIHTNGCMNNQSQGAKPAISRVRRALRENSQ